MKPSLVCVRGVPAWVDARRLLGDGGWAQADDGALVASLTAAQAAEIAARLRGVGLDGSPLDVRVTPKLARVVDREARAQEARRRRDTSVGFSRPGARLDEEGRWSLTPERLADAIARAALAELGVTAPRVVDAGCGCGGNAIAFAKAGAQVHAFDADAGRVALTAHNAGVYGVRDRVTTRVARWQDALPALSGDLLFLDPPWGLGWNRDRTTVADLPGLAEALAAAEGRFRRIWIKLPPSFATSSLPSGQPRAWFGASDGDRQRVKLVTVTLDGGAPR